MSAGIESARRLSPVQQERLRLFETGLRALLVAPVEVLCARGIVRTAAEVDEIRRRGPAWFLAADDAAAAAFFLLVEEAHAASEAALAVPSQP